MLLLIGEFTARRVHLPSKPSLALECVHVHTSYKYSISCPFPASELSAEYWVIWLLLDHRQYIPSRIASISRSWFYHIYITLLYLTLLVLLALIGLFVLFTLTRKSDVQWSTSFPSRPLPLVILVKLYFLPFNRVNRQPTVADLQLSVTRSDSVMSKYERSETHCPVWCTILTSCLMYIVLCTLYALMGLCAIEFEQLRSSCCHTIRYRAIVW